MNAVASSEVREAVGLFEDAQTFQAAIDELLLAGFDRADLSLLASEHAVKGKLGHYYERVTDLEDDDTVPRTAYVAPESRGDAEGGLVGGLTYVGATAAAGAIVASGGALAAAIVGAAVAGGIGALIGAGLAKRVGDHHAALIQEQLDRGGLLLWVHVRDANREQIAVEILTRHSGQDVHVHASSADAN